MREPRNPFKMRIAEQIESEITFLRLFSSDFLDVLPTGDLTSGLRIFRSSPGGGKTSLLRVFGPDSLKTLCDYQSIADLKALFLRMKQLKAIDEDGPKVLGIMLTCARNYASLDDITGDAAQRRRLFFSLLNARIILASLRAILSIEGKNYPEDVDQIGFTSTVLLEPPYNFKLPCTGQSLYSWAQSVEQAVCDAIDNFGPQRFENLHGHDTLHSLFAINSKHIMVDGHPITAKPLLMLDDVHTLTPNQRSKLISTLTDLRPLLGVWIAERFEALNPRELLASGVTEGREYERPINLEEFWRGSQQRNRFSKAMIDIAERRARWAREVQAVSFEPSIDNELNQGKWKLKLNEIEEEVKRRAIARASPPHHYVEWTRKTEDESSGLSPLERAVAWRAFEIQVERYLRRNQLSFDLSLPASRLENTDGSDVQGAARFFVHSEFEIPYYFGIEKLVVSASTNVEQFLAFGGDLFEEMISASLLRQSTNLSAERQETILKEACHQRWNEIPRRVSYGRDVQRFLTAAATMSLWETNKPNAPYSPGVTGIAISMSDREKLINSKREDYRRLTNTISSCISNNLLEAHIDRSQGQRGKKWMILYFNRWLCVYFGLPMNYGGWRPKKPDELCVWNEEGFRQKRSTGELL